MSELDLPANRNVDAFALIVHVWHLDTLDDLSAACDNFPAEADRFVTFADSLPPEDRKRIADRFAGAQLVAVRNVGQDVGALMQLMDLSDNDLLGLLLRRTEPEDELNSADVREVLEMLRTRPPDNAAA